jgi:hypothetical protein
MARISEQSDQYQSVPGKWPLEKSAPTENDYVQAFLAHENFENIFGTTLRLASTTNHTCILLV